MSSELIIDGSHIRDYGGFVREFNRAYLASGGKLPWNGDISDLHELLEAEEEAAGERLTIRWINSQISRSSMGHEQMADFWLKSLASIQADVFSPDGYQLVYGWEQDRLNQARAGKGRTLFEYLVWQIRGEEGEELTALILE